MNIRSLMRRHRRAVCGAAGTSMVLACSFITPVLINAQQQPAAAPPAPPTETIAPDIPGVVRGGTKVEVIAQGLRGTEGPIAAPDGTLLFTEQNASVITRIDATGARTPFLENTNGANGVTFDPKGRLVATQPDRAEIAVISPGPRMVLASEYNGQKLQRPNDIIADRKGGYYFTDPGANPPAGQAPGPTAVYYIRPNGTLLRIADDIARPNGIILSADERVLYVANTLGDAVIAFDVTDDGSVRNRRDFARLQGVTKTETGVRSGADGLAVDNTGRLYVATQIGVQVFTPEGRHLGTIPIGIANGPQNIAFAGPDKKTLYVVGRNAAWKIQMLAEGLKSRAK
jgi:gluconolactonase